MAKNKGIPDYPVERHNYTRYLYECEGLSIAKIADRCEMSEHTVMSWKKKEKWLKKGEKVEEIEHFTRQRFLEIAAKKGMGEEAFIGHVIDGIENPVKTVFGKDGDCAEDIDYATRHKYVNSFLNVAGLLNTGGKVGVNASDGAIVNIQVNHPSKDG